ncbi:MAG: hypothetical protein ABI475_07465 [Methylophilaceae bacterium]
MKIYLILCLCAASTIPLPAVADAPPNQSLGTAQATIDFCARINPAGAAQYQQRAASLVQGVLQADLDKIRSTDEYKEAYTQTSTVLDEISKPDAATACKDFLQEDKSEPASRASENEGAHDEQTY